MQIKQDLLKKTQSSLNYNKKCTRLSDCQCLMCHKQIEIIENLTLRQGLEWFGRRKSFSQNNNMLKDVQQELLRLTKHNQEKKNRKNQSQNFDRAKRHLDCSSSYLINYNKKELENTTICHPWDHLKPLSGNSSSFKTNYYDSFRSKNVKVQKQKPIKKLQIPMDLPFLGKSSYKDEFSGQSLTERSILQKPKDCFRTINIDTVKFQQNHAQNHLSPKVSDIFRPPSPIKNKGNMIKSNSYTFAYNTLYKNTFQKLKEDEILTSEPNPQFLRKSKFGSLGKTRWLTRQKIERKKNNDSLQMYS